jgi:DNA polymerase
MSVPEGLQAEIRARLEWLRLMGVDAVRRRPVTSTAREAAAVAEAAAGEEAAGEAAPPGQSGLFGPGEPDPAPGPAPGARARAAADENASPLTGALQDPPPGTDPAAALADLRATIGDCTRCRLSEKRTQVVFGVGSPHARLMFVGEGPGADEDLRGEPFVGRAGQLLTKIIEAMGLRREDVYIANIVKCRPPENRTPLPDEVGTCSPFLMRQIGIIRPRVIVCLGTPSAQTLLGTRETITRLRGNFREVAGVQVMPTFHPAYLLRNPAAKREVWEDMKQVMALLTADA